MIGNEPLILSPEQLGGSIACGKCRLQLPKTASLHWPAIPHNPYRKGRTRKCRRRPYRNSSALHVGPKDANELRGGCPVTIGVRFRLAASRVAVEDPR